MALSATKVLKKASFGLVAAAVLFLLFEGFSSIALIVHQVACCRVVFAGRLHSRYDRELGWVGIPNLYAADVYGPGKYVKTNSLGYRNQRDFDRRVPPGNVRVLCSGDSMTFGLGVANDDAWCQALEARDPRLQTVNMGQSGYGIDQMFLWYRRDIDRLDADVHILAAIDNDFVRMLSDTTESRKR
jgi:hypothetical protein